MTKTEQVVRYIMGPVRMDPKPLIQAIDIVIELVFTQNMHPEDVLATKHIYPEVARHTYKSTGVRQNHKAVARRIERLANFCWDEICQRGLVNEYLGAELRDIKAPRDMIFYLAFYIYLDEPYFTAIRKMPTLPV